VDWANARKTFAAISTAQQNQAVTLSGMIEGKLIASARASWPLQRYVSRFLQAESSAINPK
jgi:hypothetical protein